MKIRYSAFVFGATSKVFMTLQRDKVFVDQLSVAVRSCEARRIRWSSFSWRFPRIFPTNISWTVLRSEVPSPQTEQTDRLGYCVCSLRKALTSISIDRSVSKTLRNARDGPAVMVVMSSMTETCQCWSRCRIRMQNEGKQIRRRASSFSAVPVLVTGFVSLAVLIASYALLSSTPIMCACVPRKCRHLVLGIHWSITSSTSILSLSNTLGNKWAKTLGSSCVKGCRISWSRAFSFHFRTSWSVYTMIGCLVSITIHRSSAKLFNVA